MAKTRKKGTAPKGTQHPKDAAEEGTPVLPRTPSPVLAAGWFRDEGMQDGSVGAGQVRRLGRGIEKEFMELFRSKVDAPGREHTAAVG